MKYLYNWSNNYHSGQITITVQKHHVTFTIFVQKWSFQKCYWSGPRILKNWHMKMTLWGTIQLI